MYSAHTPSEDTSTDGARVPARERNIPGNGHYWTFWVFRNAPNDIFSQPPQSTAFKFREMNRKRNWLKIFVKKDPIQTKF